MARLSGDELGFEPFDPREHARGKKLYTLRSEEGTPDYTLVPSNVSYDVARAAPWRFVVKLQENTNKARGEGMGTGGERQGDTGVDECVCPECGKEYPHKRGVPCTQQTCPDCSVALIGADEKKQGGVGAWLRNIAESVRGFFTLSGRSKEQPHPAEDRKQTARWVTIEDRPVLIGGPQQGAGRATSARPAGEGEAVTSPEDLAKRLRQDAEQFEPELTETISDFVEEGGGEMYGLDHRLKTESSIQKKILRDEEEKGVSPEVAAMGISDLVRYTALFDGDSLTDKATELQTKLSEAGWERYDHKWKNFYTSNGPYRGYNTVYQNSAGQRFELQFHTPESMELKDLAHGLYEQFRDMPRGEAREELERQCVRIWDEFIPPDDHEDLQGVAIP